MVLRAALPLLVFALLGAAPEKSQVPSEQGLPPPPTAPEPLNDDARACRTPPIIMSAEHHRVCAAACDAGDMPSCGMAASDLELGLGIARDVPKAIALYLRACDSGHAVAACFIVGKILVEGESGTTRDAAKGRALIRKGCKGGDEMACEYLKGVRYELREVHSFHRDGGAPPDGGK